MQREVAMLTDQMQYRGDEERLPEEVEAQGGDEERLPEEVEAQVVKCRLDEAPGTAQPDRKNTACQMYENRIKNKSIQFVVPHIVMLFWVYFLHLVKFHPFRIAQGTQQRCNKIAAS